MCGFKILFAAVIVFISVIITNKISTFSCSWVKTLNNKILIGKKNWKKKVGKKNWYNFFKNSKFDEIIENSSVL